MAKKYNVSDGKLLLTLEEAEEGGFVVTSPLDPELITEADTISDAFMMARDALKALAESRAKPLKKRRYRDCAAIEEISIANSTTKKRARE